jgi:hypothetical protein
VFFLFGWGCCSPLNYDFICLVDEKVKDQTEKEQKISD